MDEKARWPWPTARIMPTAIALVPSQIVFLLAACVWIAPPAAARPPKGPLGPIDCAREPGPEDPGRPLAPQCLVASPYRHSVERRHESADSVFPAEDAQTGGIPSARFMLQSIGEQLNLSAGSVFDGTNQRHGRPPAWPSEDRDDPRSFLRADYEYMRARRRQNNPAAHRLPHGLVAANNRREPSPPSAAPIFTPHARSPGVETAEIPPAEPVVRPRGLHPRARHDAPSIERVPPISALPPGAADQRRVPTDGSERVDCVPVEDLAACFAVSSRHHGHHRDGPPPVVDVYGFIPGIHSRWGPQVYGRDRLHRFAGDRIVIVTNTSYSPITHRHLEYVERSFGVKIGKVTIAGHSGAGNCCHWETRGAARVWVEGGLNATARDLGLRINRVILNDVVANLKEELFGPLRDSGIPIVGYISSYRQPLAGVTLQVLEGHYAPLPRCTEYYLASAYCPSVRR